MDPITLMKELFRLHEVTQKQNEEIAYLMAANRKLRDVVEELSK